MGENLNITGGAGGLFGFAPQDFGWTEMDYYRLQSQLWQLMEKQTRRYTSGDSSSIPVEIAEEIKQGIYFCIGSYFNANGTAAENADALRTEPLSDLFRKGQQVVWRQVEVGKSRFGRALETAISIKNISYMDTLRALPDFFKQYDVFVMAHDIPVMIDYQLAVAVPETCRGIDYINEYLRRLVIENVFCGYFDAAVVERLLRAEYADFQLDLINLFEPVFRNALGLHLLGKPVNALNITEDDQKNLLALFHTREKSQIRQICGEAFLSLCESMHFNEKDAADYLNAVAMGIAGRIAAFKETGLRQIFLSF